MNFVDCLEIFSTYKDLDLSLPRKGQCCLSVDNVKEICFISLIFTKDKEIYNENLMHELKTHKVSYFQV